MLRLFQPAELHVKSHQRVISFFNFIYHLFLIHIWDPEFLGWLLTNFRRWTGNGMTRTDSNFNQYRQWSNFVGFPSFSRTFTALLCACTGPAIATPLVKPVLITSNLYTELIYLVRHETFQSRWGIITILQYNITLLQHDSLNPWDGPLDICMYKVSVITVSEYILKYTMVIDIYKIII